MGGKGIPCDSHSHFHSVSVISDNKVTSPGHKFLDTLKVIVHLVTHSHRSFTFHWGSIYEISEHYRGGRMPLNGGTWVTVSLYETPLFQVSCFSPSSSLPSPPSSSSHHHHHNCNYDHHHCIILMFCRHGACPHIMTLCFTFPLFFFMSGMGNR